MSPRRPRRGSAGPGGSRSSRRPSPAGRAGEKRRLVAPQAGAAVQRRVEAQVVGVLEDEAVALRARQLGVVPVEHGVLEAADRAHHRHRAVAQRDHLRQAAGLVEARHDQQVRAGVDQVREFLVVADLEVAVGVVVQPALEVPEVLVDAVLRAGAEQHELRVVLERVEQRVADEVQALLGVESADVGDDRPCARRAAACARAARRCCRPCARRSPRRSAAGCGDRSPGSTSRSRARSGCRRTCPGAGAACGRVRSRDRCGAPPRRGAATRW